jgi:hypothetical protein
MKQVQIIENYRCLEARVQCHNKWTPRSKDQSLFSVMEDTLQQLMMWDFFMTLMAKRWSDPSDAFIFASTTFPNPLSPKILIG